MVRYFANVENLETPDTKITDSGYFVPSATPETFRLENYFTKIKRELDEYRKAHKEKGRFAFPQGLATVPERAIGSLWVIDWMTLDRDIFRKLKNAFNSEAAIKFRYTDLPTVRDAWKTYHSWQRTSADLGEFLWWKKETRDLFEKYWTSGQADNWVADHRDTLSLPFEFFIDIAWFATSLSKIARGSVKLAMAKKTVPLAKKILRLRNADEIQKVLINSTSGGYPVRELCEGLARNSSIRKLSSTQVARVLSDFNLYPIDYPLSKIFHRMWRPRSKWMIPGLFDDVQSIKKELGPMHRWYQEKLTKGDQLQFLLKGSPEDKARKLDRVYRIFKDYKRWPTFDHYIADMATGRAPYNLTPDELQFAKGMKGVLDEYWVASMTAWPKVSNRFEWTKPLAARIHKISGKSLRLRTIGNEIQISGLDKIPQARILLKTYDDIFNASPKIAATAQKRLTRLLAPGDSIYNQVDELVRLSASSPPYRRNYVKGTELLVTKPKTTAKILGGLKSYEKARLADPVITPENVQEFSKTMQQLAKRTWPAVIKRRDELLVPLKETRKSLTNLLGPAAKSRKPAIQESIDYIDNFIDSITKIPDKDIAKLNIKPNRIFGFLGKVFKPANWSKWQKQMQILYNPGAWINNAVDSTVTKNALKNDNWADFIIHPDRYPEWGITGEALDFAPSKLATKFTGAESKIARAAGTMLEGPETFARNINGRIGYWLKTRELQKTGIFDLKEIHKLAMNFAGESNRFTHFNYGDLTLFDMAMAKVPVFPYWFWGSRNAKFYGAQFVKRPTLFLKLNQLRNWYNQHTSVDGKGGSVLNVPGLGDVKINSLDYLSFNRFIKTAENLSNDEFYRPTSSFAEGQGFNMLYSAIGPPAEWIRMLSTGIVPDQTWRYISPWTRVLRAGTGISIEDYMNDLMGKNATLNREDWERKRSESIQAQYEWEYKQKIPFSQAINQMRKQERILSVMGLFGVYAKPYQTWDKLIETDRSLYFELKDPTQKTLWYKNHPWIFPHSTPGPRDLELDIKLEGYEKKKPEEIKSELPKEPIDVIKYVSNFMTDKIAPAVFETVFPAEKVKAAELKLVLPEERADFPNELQSIKPEYRKDGKYQMYGFKKGEEWKGAPVLRPVFPNLSLQRNKANSDRMKVLGFLNTEISKTDTLEEAQEILKKYPKQVASYKEVRSVVPVYGNIQNVIQNEETIRHVKYKKHAGNTILGEIKDTLDAKNKEKLWARDEKEWTKAGVKISEKALEDIKVDFRTQYEINLKEAEDTDRNKLRETYSSVRAELQRLNWAEDAVARVTERDPDAVNNMQTVWPETTFNVEAGKYAPAAAQANQYVISRKWDIDSYRELTPFQRENLAFFYGTHRTRMTDAAIPFRERPPWLEKFQEQKIDYLKPLQDWKEIYVEKAVDEQYRQALNEQMPLVPPEPVFDTPQTFLTFAVGQTLAHNKLNPNNPVNIFQKSGEIMKQGLAQYGFRVIPQAGKAIADFGFSMGMMDKKTHSEFVGLSYDAASGITAGSLAASAFGKLSVATPVGITTGITTFLSKQLGRARAAEERKRWRARRDVERELYYKRVERERERIRVGRAKRTREIEYRQKLRAWMREGAKMPELLKQPAWFMRRFVEPRRVVVERWMRRPTFQTKVGLIESAKRELRAPKIKW